MDYTIKTVAIHPMTEVTGVLATTINLRRCVYENKYGFVYG